MCSPSSRLALYSDPLSEGPPLLPKAIGIRERQGPYLAERLLALVVQPRPALAEIYCLNRQQGQPIEQPRRGVVSLSLNSTIPDAAMIGLERLKSPITAPTLQADSRTSGKVRFWGVMAFLKGGRDRSTCFPIIPARDLIWLVGLLSECVDEQLHTQGNWS